MLNPSDAAYGGEKTADQVFQELRQRVENLVEECRLANEIIETLSKTARPTLEILPLVMRYNVLVELRSSRPQALPAEAVPDAH